MVSADFCVDQEFESSCSQSQSVSRPCWLNRTHNMLAQVIWDIKEYDDCFKASYYTELLYSRNESSVTCTGGHCLDIDVIDASESYLLTIACDGFTACSNFNILCPGIYDENIASNHNDTNCIIMCGDGLCHNISIFVPQHGVLRIDCGDLCSNITIYGDFAQSINVYCKECEYMLIHATYVHTLYLYSLKSSTVYAEHSYLVSLDSLINNYTYSYPPQQSVVNLYVNHSNNITIICHQQQNINDTFACDSINIFAGNACDINMIADGRYAANNISLYAKYAYNVNIEGFERNALIASTILALNANFLNISCLGGYDTFSCSDSSFYLSSIQSIINCQGFGCVNISLFINDSVVNDKYRFNINGCNQCHSLKECTNDWNIFYLNNQILEHYINTTFIDDDDECKLPLLPQTPYVIEYDVYRNRTVRDISIMLSCVYAILLLIIFSVMIYEVIKYVIKKCNKTYISKRPYDFLLWGSFFCEVFIFVASYSWMVKATLFRISIHEYCTATYRYQFDSWFDISMCIQCNNDPTCSCSYAYYNDGGSYNNAYCSPIEPYASAIHVWWLFIALLTVTEFARCILASCCHDYINADDTVDNWPDGYPTCGQCCVYYTSKQCSIHCVFWKYMVKGSVWRQRFYEEIFWKRRLWRVPPIKNKCVLFYYVSDMITRYNVPIIFGLFFWIKDRSIFAVGDSGIRWFDIIPVLILLIVKFAFQCYYLTGDEYHLRQDWPHVIDEILTNKYGDQLGWIIKFYLPIFHDEILCPSWLLITKQSINRCSNIDSVSHGKLTSSYLLMKQHNVNNVINSTAMQMTVQSSTVHNDDVVDLKCDGNGNTLFLLQTQTESNTDEKVNDINPLLDDYKPPAIDSFE